MGKFDVDLGSLLKKLEEKEEKAGGDRKEFTSDMWKPTIEKGQERAEYTIRFLPNLDSKDGFPFVERYAHMFPFPSTKKFCYVPCKRRTFKDYENEQCYICEETKKLYSTGDPDQELLGQKRNAKLRYFYTVLIINDPRDGGKNNGQVKILECGPKVHEHCQKFLKNTKISKEDRIFFHPTNGCNFNLVVKMQKTTNGEFQNYDDSGFDRENSAIVIDGKELSSDEADKFVAENGFKLNEKLLSDSVFKSYDEVENYYINQGDLSKVKKPVKEDSGEEVEESLEDVAEDKTVSGQTVSARNPEKTLDVDREVDDMAKKLSSDPVEEDDDDDAALEAILNNQ